MKRVHVIQVWHLDGSGKDPDTMSCSFEMTTKDVIDLLERLNAVPAEAIKQLRAGQSATFMDRGTGERSTLTIHEIEGEMN